MADQNKSGNLLQKAKTMLLELFLKFKMRGKQDEQPVDDDGNSNDDSSAETSLRNILTRRSGTTTPTPLKKKKIARGRFHLWL